MQISFYVCIMIPGVGTLSDGLVRLVAYIQMKYHLIFNKITLEWYGLQIRIMSAENAHHERIYREV